MCHLHQPTHAHYLINLLFSYARRICSIDEDENIKEKRFNDKIDKIKNEILISKSKLYLISFDKLIGSFT